MSLDYVAGDERGTMLCPVNAGDIVQFEAIGLEDAGRDSAGRWPHLRFVPGSVNAPAGAAHYTIPFQPPYVLPEYRDNGSFYVSQAGQAFVVGGSGSFRIESAVDRSEGCEQPQEFRWKLTSYTVNGARLNNITVPRGAELLKVTTGSRVELFHGAGATDLFTDLATNAEVYLQSVTRISFEPNVREGQLTIHGRM